MTKKYAWTIAEFIIALIIVTVISGFLLRSYKPASQTTKIQVYAAIRNIEKAIIAVEDKYYKKVYGDESNNEANRTIFYPNPHEEPENDTYNTKFCQEIVDTLSVKESQCDSTDITKPNAILSNGVALYGLNSKPVTFAGEPLEARKYSYLNIVVDVDGEKGINKVGIDRFPLRIFAVDNLVLPVDCSETQFYNWRRDGVQFEDDATIDTRIVTTQNAEGKKIDTGIRNLDDASKNPYCKTGKTFNGPYSDINLQTNDELITYDTYLNMVKSDGEGQKYDTLIAYSKPYAETVCGNFGGEKYKSAAQCAQLNLKIFAKCQTLDTCENCGKVSPSICPMKEGGSQMDKTACLAQYNELNVVDAEHPENNTSAICYFILHQPSSGLSSIVGGMVGSDVEMN